MAEDVLSRWHEDRQLATAMHSSMVYDPAIRLSGYHIPPAPVSVLKRFRTVAYRATAAHMERNGIRPTMKCMIAAIHPDDVAHC